MRGRRLTEEQISKIKALLAKNWDHTRIAKKLGVRVRTVAVRDPASPLYRETKSDRVKAAPPDSLPKLTEANPPVWCPACRAKITLVPCYACWLRQQRALRSSVASAGR